MRDFPTADIGATAANARSVRMAAPLRGTLKSFPQGK
jgi:hypothetical protein